MGMNYWHFANTFGQSTETRRIMIQGLIYLEFQEYYDYCKNEFGTETADSLMLDIVNFSWELYLGETEYNPIEIGKAFYYMFTDYFDNSDEEKFNLFDIQNNFEFYFDLVRQ